MLRWASCLCVLIALNAGCQRRDLGTWTLGKEAKKLSPELQTKVVSVLEERCGTLDTPKMLGDDKFDANKCKYSPKAWAGRTESTAHRVTR
ncbi:MAG: hypothetical protein NT013_24780 [Planctomycetia bacterium]|nr:hypothetical protein [Planctomycetia bacterium]